MNLGKIDLNTMILGQKRSAQTIINIWSTSFYYQPIVWPTTCIYIKFEFQSIYHDFRQKGLPKINKKGKKSMVLGKNRSF